MRFDCCIVDHGNGARMFWLVIGRRVLVRKFIGAWDK